MRKRLRYAFVILVILLGSVITPNLSYAEDICIPLNDAKKMVVELDKTQIYVKQIALLERANIQLTEQNTILLEQTIILKEQIQLKQEQLDLVLKENESQKKIYEDKIKLYEKEKPSFIDKAIIGISGAGIGVIIGALLIAVL